MAKFALRLRSEHTGFEPRGFAFGVGLLLLAEAFAFRLNVFQRVLLDKLERIQDDSARGYLCLSLGMLRAKEATEPIRRIIEESKYRPELLQQAAIALGLMGDDQLVASLIETMNKAGSLSSQAALSSALGFIGDRNSIDPLVTMLENGELSKSARGFAAVALGIIADREPLPRMANGAPSGMPGALIEAYEVREV